MGYINISTILNKNHEEYMNAENHISPGLKTIYVCRLCSCRSGELCSWCEEQTGTSKHVTTACIWTMTTTNKQTSGCSLFHQRWHGTMFLFCTGHKPQPYALPPMCDRACQWQQHSVLNIGWTFINSTLLGRWDYLINSNFCSSPSYCALIWCLSVQLINKALFDFGRPSYSKPSSHLTADVKLGWRCRSPKRNAQTF